MRLSQTVSEVFTGLFAGFNVKGAQDTVLVPSWNFNRPMSTVHGFKNYVKQGYQNVIWVYRCIVEIATAVSSVPLIVSRVSPDGEQATPLPSHKLQQLLGKPNYLMGRSDLLEWLVTYLLIAGASYQHIVRAGENNDKGDPLELWPIRPDYMKAVSTPEFLVDHYVLDKRDVGGKPIPLRREEVLAWKLIDPLDPLVGLSPIGIASRQIDIANMSSEWNRNLFLNSAQPSGGLQVPKDVQLSPIQRLELKQAISEQFSGRNRFRPMLLEGGMEWKPFAFSPKDLDFLQSQKDLALTICALFGVPPELVGADRPKYENYKIARISFWEETVLPLIGRIIEQMNNNLVPLFMDNKNVQVLPDLANIPAMRDAFVDRADTAVSLVQAGWPLNAVNRRLALGFNNVDWGDTSWVPGNVVNIVDILEGTLESDE